MKMKTELPPDHALSRRSGWMCLVALAAAIPALTTFDSIALPDSATPDDQTASGLKLRILRIVGEETGSIPYTVEIKTMDPDSLLEMLLRRLNFWSDEVRPKRISRLPDIAELESLIKLGKILPQEKQTVFFSALAAFARNVMQPLLRESRAQTLNPEDEGLAHRHVTEQLDQYEQTTARIEALAPAAN